LSASSIVLLNTFDPSVTNDSVILFSLNAFEHRQPDHDPEERDKRDDVLDPPGDVDYPDRLNAYIADPVDEDRKRADHP
jgi:hypothetical protein